MKRSKTIQISAFLLLVGAGIATADSLEFVNIGSAGNAADTTGYGAVGYDFQISKTEISIAQYQQSGLGGGDFWNTGGQTIGTNAPAASISWNQAAAYCNWLTETANGNSSKNAYTFSGATVTAIKARTDILSDGGVVYVIPTEDEWYKAAYFTGTGYSLFSDGSGTAPANAIYGLGGAGNPEVVEHPSLEQNNTLNMGGNVQEWLEDATAGGEALNLSDPSQGMALRGGSYAYGDANMAKDFRFTAGGLVTRNGESEDTGFRVVAIPEPGTISLMSLSTVSLFLTRTMRRRKRVGQSLMPVRREPLCDVFVSEQEWRSAYHEIEDDGYFTELGRQLRSLVVSRVNAVAGGWRSLDRLFWSRMVARHERKVAKRKARIETFKKKALHGFDEFLALIMK